MTERKWPARVSGDRLLCGRQVEGRYVCQGEIAVLMFSSGGIRRAGLRGFVEKPSGSGRWEPTVTGKEKLAAGYKRSAYKRRAITTDGRRVYPVKVPPLPWTRDCPHQNCKCTALVDSAVLESAQ